MQNGKRAFWISAAVFLLTAGVTLYYITVLARGEFHGDCTDTIMWAAASYESGRLFDPTFTYACFLPFGVNLLMLPLIGLFGVSVTTHVIGMALFFLLFTGSFLLMLREMEWRWSSAFLAASALLALTLSSPKLREIFWGHTIYYSLGVLFLFGGMWLFLRFFRLWKRRGEKKARVHLILTGVSFFVFTLLCATDGISALSIFALPLMAAVFAEGLMRTPALRSRTTALTAVKVIVIGAAVAGGILLNKALVGEMRAGYEEAYSTWSGMSNWVPHLQKLPLAWLQLFGVEDMTGEPLASADSAVNLLRMLAALLLAVLPVAAALCYKKFEKSAERIWIWIHWAGTAIITAGFVCGQLSAANWRLTPVMATALVVSALFLRRFVTKNRLAALIAVPLALVAAYNVVSVAVLPADGYKDNVLYQLEEQLEERGLTYGYATFWQANPITVISGERVRVRDVTVSDAGRVDPRAYQSSSRWYEDQPGVERYFLLLEPGEYSKLYDYDNPLLEQAAEETWVDLPGGASYCILEFEGNIF